MDILVPDVIDLLLNIVSPSSYYCLYYTSKMFQNNKRKFKTKEIIIKELC